MKALLKTCCVTVALLLLVSIIGASAQMSDEECTSSGFNRFSLKCSACDMLENFQLNTIEDTCQQCCTEDSAEVKGLGKKFPKALLEVCWCKFPSMPQIEAFIKGEGSKKFPNLAVKHVNGAPPTIKMINGDGNIEQTLSISKWDTDTIEEFLRTHLE